MQDHDQFVGIIRFRSDPTRAENQFGDGVAAGVAVNPNGGSHIPVDPGVGPRGIELGLADQFDSFGPGGGEASRVPVERVSPTILQ
jgi:hypothetical protein